MMDNIVLNCFIEEIMKIPYIRVELNVTELCNRKCSFCPRSLDYPNKNLHMEADTAELLIEQTKDFVQHYSITGRGEPLLCKNIYEILSVFRIHNVPFNLTTNGDTLDKCIHDLDAILDLKKYEKQIGVIVNCYDGENQLNIRKIKYAKYKKLFFTNEREDVPENENYQKRMSKGFFSNRGGNLPWSYSNLTTKPCYILMYKSMIDWNGDVNLCCNDWKYLKSFGNIHKHSFREIWLGEEMSRYRNKLMEKNGRQNFEECKNCDAIGSNPFRRWDVQMDQMKPYFNFYT